MYDTIWFEMRPGDRMNAVHSGGQPCEYEPMDPHDAGLGPDAVLLHDGAIDHVRVPPETPSPFAGKRLPVAIRDRVECKHPGCADTPHEVLTMVLGGDSGIVVQECVVHGWVLYQV